MTPRPVATALAVFALAAFGALVGRAFAPAPAGARSLPGSFADVVEATNPSVVHVAIRHDDGARRTSRDDGVGGGFIVDSSGLLVTSRHVVSGARQVLVTAPGSGPHVARIVGVDEATDIAVLHVPALVDRPPLPIGDPRALRVGEVVLLAGSPFALPNSWSLGIVSGLGRSGLGVSPRAFEDFIQTDAAANLGSSGGPLLSSDGRVIGVISAILSRGGAHQGVTLATPIDAVLAAVARIAGRSSDRPARAALALGLSVRPQSGGLIVTRVEDGGAAARGGLRPGDVLTRAGDRPLTTAADLHRATWDVPEGGALSITFLRAGRVERTSLR